MSCQSPLRCLYLRRHAYHDALATSDRDKANAPLIQRPSVPPATPRNVGAPAMLGCSSTPPRVLVVSNCAAGKRTNGATDLTEKQRRIVRLAVEYVMRHRLTSCPCRFDVVSIHVDAGRPTIDVFQNAFHA